MRLFFCAVLSAKRAKTKKPKLKITIMSYEEIAANFAAKYNLKLKVSYNCYDYHFAEDKQKRHIFRCRLLRRGKSYTFLFGQSISSGCVEPTMYDVLSCLQKSDIGTFSDFCSEFGYDEDSRNAERTYKAVLREHSAMCRLFPESQDSEVWRELSEIW